MASASDEPTTTTSSSLLDLNVDVVAEILLRLPSTSVLRCRAVCRAWRGITSSPDFVAAYARRRPLELIVQHRGPNGVLDTIPLATLDEASRRCLHPGYPSRDREDTYTLMGSCGDLLLFQASFCIGGSGLWVCNPVTRQWAAVPPPHEDGLTLPCGLYRHKPSGEHRLLFLANDSWSDMYGSASHHVASLLQGQAVAVQTTTTYSYRRLGPALADVYILSRVLTIECFDYHGKLHWLDHPEVWWQRKKILAFDTVSETFRRMSRPPSSGKKKNHDEDGHVLMEMDGLLAMTVFLYGSTTRMDLWVLEDYGDDGSWTCRHRIDLPPTLLHTCWAMDASALSLEQQNNGSSASSGGGNVILLGDAKSLSLGLYDLTEKRLLKQIQPFANSARGPGFCTHMNRLVFRDSLP